MATDNLSAETVRELLGYDPETGVFRWKKRVAHRVQAGDVAGTDGIRARRLMILSKPFLAHRVAWLYVHGRWPDGVIDHINRDPFDNRIANLRDVTQRENIQNASMSRRNTSGVRGVFWRADRGSWRAEIKVDYKSKYLGDFKTLEEASKARADAEAACFAPINRKV